MKLNINLTILACLGQSLLQEYLFLDGSFHVSSTSGPRTSVSDCLEISLKCFTTIQMEKSEV